MRKVILEIIEDVINFHFGNTYAGEIMRFDDFMNSINVELRERTIEIRPFELFHIVMNALNKHERYVDFCDDTAFIISKGTLVKKGDWSEITENDSEVMNKVELSKLRTFLIADEEYVAKRAKNY